MDMQSGIFERFHSMPIARSAPLWGHVLTSLLSNAISVVVIILVALLMGFRSSAGVWSWLAVAGILALFTLALTWIAATAVYQFGLRADRVDAVRCSRLCRKPAGDLDRGSHPRAAVKSAGGQ